VSAAERSTGASPRFGTVVTAMVTPFGPNGELDLDAAAALARHLVDNGSDGLVVAGSTGEGSVLTDPERISLFRAVIEAVSVPVIASTGTNDTAHSIQMTREAEAAGAAAVLVVTPYYNRPSAAGLSAHFRAVAEVTELPVVLYDVPVRSGRRIGPDLTIQLATEVVNIVAVKDATGDVASAARVVAEAPDGFQLYAGDDSLALPFASVGGVGIVSVAAHWAGPAFGQMLGAYRSGDVATAAEVNRSLLESYRFESSDEYPNPVPVKAACRALGLAVGQCRLPNAPAHHSLDDQARSVIAGVPRLTQTRQSVA
jgi:4-hydroxy-tetrahydrodipicolinate synthase